MRRAVRNPTAAPTIIVATAIMNVVILRRRSARWTKAAGATELSSSQSVNGSGPMLAIREQMDS